MIYGETFLLGLSSAHLVLHLVSGAGATPWSTSQDIADGMAYLQVDVGLFGNPLTDAVPIVDTVVVPTY